MNGEQVNYTAVLADNGIEILPVPLFLRELWEGRILG